MQFAIFIVLLFIAVLLLAGYVSNKKDAYGDITLIGGVFFIIGVIFLHFIE